MDKKIQEYFENYKMGTLGTIESISPMPDWKEGKRFAVVTKTGLIRKKRHGYTVYEKGGELVTVKPV